MEADNLLGLSVSRKRAIFLSYCSSEVFEMTEVLGAPTAIQTMPWMTLQNTLQARYVPMQSKIVRQQEPRRKARQSTNILQQSERLRHILGLESWTMCC